MGAADVGKFELEAEVLVVIAEVEVGEVEVEVEVLVLVLVAVVRVRATLELTLEGTLVTSISSTGCGGSDARLSREFIVASGIDCAWGRIAPFA